VIGLGGIARETIRLLTAFGMRLPLACDPYVDAADGASLGVQLVDLDTLLGRADFVSLHCPLNDSTRGLLGARELALMKPDAYLINTARGGLVDEDALLAALTEGRIAGAAIDCFADEPHTDPRRWQDLDNVILAPHCIGWTDELFRDMGRAACRGIVELAQGRRPHGMVNPEVLAKPSFREKWRRLRIAPD
jgi:phosphoglycerate dehydrogenase-like enzyme